MQSKTSPGKAVAPWHPQGKATPPSRRPSSSAVAKAVPGKVSAALAKQAPNTGKADGRTFHVEDYRKASQLVKQLREGKTGTTKQAWCDALAASMAAVFEADSKQFGVPFNAQYFVDGTR